MSLVVPRVFDRFGKRATSASSLLFFPAMLSIYCIPTPRDHPTTARCSTPCITCEGSMVRILFANSELADIAAVMEANGNAVKDFLCGASKA